MKTLVFAKHRCKICGWDGVPVEGSIWPPPYKKDGNPWVDDTSDLCIYCAQRLAEAHKKEKAK